MIDLMPFLQLVGLALGVGLITYTAAGVASEKLWLTDAVKGRSNHRRPASRAGGLVILAVVAVNLVIALLLGWPLPPAIAGTALIAAVFGILDDISDIPARIKMGALLVLCAFAAALAGPMPYVPLPLADTDLPQVAGYVLATLILFGFLNAFNFMDGLNGMAGSAGVIGLCLIIALVTPAAGGLLFICVLTAAALYGFVVRNLLKGGIFLGDGGSLGLAMLLSAGALHASQFRPESIYIFGIAFLPFFLDVALTLWRRARRGERLMDAHKEHMYQRLRAAGWSHQAVSAGYSLLILIGAASALALEARFGAMGLWTAGGFTVILTAVMWRVMFALRVSSAAPQS